MELNEQDKITLINLMIEYSKQSWFPFYEKIRNSDDMNKLIFWRLEREEYYKFLLKDYFEKQIEIHSWSKMWKLFKSHYEKNKKLFLEFCILNINKNFNEKFNEVWNEIKSYLNMIEFELFKSIDNSQYKSFAWWLDNKYKALIKTMFPYYDNIWVKVKNINL